MAYSLIAGVPSLVSYLKSALVSNEKQKPFKTPESILPPVPSYFSFHCPPLPSICREWASNSEPHLEEDSFILWEGHRDNIVHGHQDPRQRRDSGHRVKTDQKVRHPGLTPGEAESLGYSLLSLVHLKCCCEAGSLTIDFQVSNPLYIIGICFSAPPTHPFSSTGDWTLDIAHAEHTHYHWGTCPVYVRGIP